MERVKKRPVSARNPQARENQLINLAMNLAEEKLRDGTASSQIITAILNLGTTRHQLENDKLKSDLRVAEAKIEAMNRQENSSELYEKALTAFKSYQGDNIYEEEMDGY